MLRYELTSWDAANGNIKLIEVNQLESFNRLTAYTHMFKQHALDDFVELGEESAQDYLDESRRELGDDHLDNNRAEQNLEDFKSEDYNVGGTIVGKLILKLNDLEASLEQSMT